MSSPVAASALSPSRPVTSRRGGDRPDHPGTQCLTRQHRSRGVTTFDAPRQRTWPRADMKGEHRPASCPAVGTSTAAPSICLRRTLLPAAHRRERLGGQRHRTHRLRPHGIRGIGAAYRRALRHDRRTRLIGAPPSLHRELTRPRLDHHLLDRNDGVAAVPKPLSVQQCGVRWPRLCPGAMRSPVHVRPAGSADRMADAGRPPIPRSAPGIPSRSGPRPGMRRTDRSTHHAGAGGKGSLHQPEARHQTRGYPGRRPLR